MITLLHRFVAFPEKQYVNFLFSVEFLKRNGKEKIVKNNRKKPLNYQKAVEAAEGNTSDLGIIVRFFCFVLFK